MAPVVAAAAPAPASFWAATARPAPQLPALDGDRQTDVVIVGGGYTGLAAARELAARGVDCLLLEAADIGWGASGRNGGFAVPRYKLGFAALAAAWGNETTRRLHAMVLEAIDTLEETVAEHRIDCGFARAGHLTAAHSEAALAALAADAEWLAREAGDRSPRLLDRRAAAEEIGSTLYCGGYLDPRGAMIHPLDYARGLAAGLARRGVPIFVGSPATALAEESAAVVVTTPGGRVRARGRRLAGNAYTPPGIAGLPHRRVVPVSTSVVATRPLSPNLLGSVMAGNRAVSDTKHIMHYFRRLPGDRLLFGGRGDITGRRDDPAIYRGLERSLGRLFPALDGIGIEHRWSGFVAVTLDGFPHVGRLGERIVYAMGYGGRGVALTNLLGKYAARLALGETVEAGPMGGAGFRRVPFHRLRIPGMKLAAAWYGWQDRRAMRAAGRGG